MKKLRLDGGLKLIDIHVRINTSRSMWLMDLAVNPDLRTNLAIMTTLVNQLKGGLQGIELIFTNNFYCLKLLSIPFSAFYLEALKAVSLLDLSKQVADLNKEKIFYNPIFKDTNMRPLAIPRRCEME